jgi:hypothetical protein
MRKKIKQKQQRVLALVISLWEKMAVFLYKNELAYPTTLAWFNRGTKQKEALPHFFDIIPLLYHM